VSGELANRVLPHLEADVRLAEAIAEPQRGRLITELNEQRRELGRLVEELDRLLFDVAARPRASAPRRRAAGNLDQVARLLDRHLAGDRELQMSFEAAPDGDRRWAGLVEEAEAGERVAARSLRFVWHPPVAPTEAKALRKNPNATRVVILDAEDASAARAAGTTATNGGFER
jgi:hypothetical protein